MAKIGTAHVEVKAVINDEALNEISARVEEAVRKGVEAGMAAARPSYEVQVTGSWPVDRTASCPCRPENGGSGVCNCILGGPQVTC